MIEKSFSKTQKISLILLSLKEELSTKIIEHLSDEEIKKIIECMSKLGTVPAFTVQNLTKELCDDLDANGSIVGSEDAAQLFLRQHVSSTRAEEIIKRLNHNEESDEWNKISNVPDNTLFKYLQNEHPQTMSFIFRKIDPQICARVVKNFNRTHTKIIINRILKSNSINENISESVKNAFYKYITGSNHSDLLQDKHEQVAFIANNMDKSNESYFMEIIESTNVEDAEKIKNLMFSFEDFLKVSSEDIKVLTDYIDRKQLALALKGTNEALRNAFLSVFPERVRRNILDEMEDMGNVQLTDVELARFKIMKEAKRLENLNLIDLDLRQAQRIMIS